MKQRYYAFFILVILIVVSGCTSVGSEMQTAPTLKSYPTSTNKPPTITPTLSPIPRPSRTPDSTLTPLPTIEPEKVGETLKELLQEPIGCVSPCFLGIVPSQTTFSEAENIISSLGLKLEHSNTTGDKKIYETVYEFDSGLSINPLFTSKNSIIENITIYIIPEKQKSGIPREWLAYSPEMMINRFGIPSYVGFALDWGPRSFFAMAIYFDDVDLIVEYSGYDIIPRQKGPSRICPLTDQFEDVRVWFGKNPINPPGGFVSLEQATSLTMENFSDLIIGNPANACLVVNGDAFP